MNEQELKHRKAKEHVNAMRGFYKHLGVYVLVNLGLVVLNLTNSPDTLWFIWPLGGWGIAVALHAWRVFLRPAHHSNWEEKKIAKLMEND